MEIQGKDNPFLILLHFVHLCLQILLYTFVYLYFCLLIILFTYTFVYLFFCLLIVLFAYRCCQCTAGGTRASACAVTCSTTWPTASWSPSSRLQRTTGPRRWSKPGECSSGISLQLWSLRDVEDVFSVIILPKLSFYFDSYVTRIRFEMSRFDALSYCEWF